MLIGSYVQRIDIKGRTAVPFRFKKELGTEVILARWYEKCLAIFALNDWGEMVKEATSGGVLAAPARDTERFLLGGAYETNLDAQGRFVMPQALRAHSSLEGAKEVVFVGLNRRVEVWSKESWQNKEKEIVDKAEQLIEEVRTGKSNKV